MFQRASSGELAGALLIFGVVKNNSNKLKVFLATDPEEIPLRGSGEANGKTHGLISFCIPDYAVLFRCRILSNHGFLLLTAAITALRFVERSYTGKRNPEIVLCTHVPAGYYLLTHDSKRRNTDPLKDYREKFSLEIRLVERPDNQALAPVSELPLHPLDASPPLKLKKTPGEQSARMAPLKDGIEL